MKSIAAVNCEIPIGAEPLEYFGGMSLRDYDIAILNPEFPYLSRVEFSAGGSCLSIDSTNSIEKALNHWAAEIKNAIKAGKTIFVVASQQKIDSAANGSTLSKGQRSYSTYSISNYRILPIKLDISNAKGRKVGIKDSAFSTLAHVLSSMWNYEVVFDSGLTSTAFVAPDGASVGGYIAFKEMPGHIVFLPNFEFDSEEFIEKNDDGEAVWNKSAISKSKALVSQLVAIDKHLRDATATTPEPAWLDEVPMPSAVLAADKQIREIDEQIARLKVNRERIEEERLAKRRLAALLFETGKPLENAIAKALTLLGYAADSFQSGDLEIDHVIISPSGKRMIGESEGKNTSAIDVSKFRQLESNIGEDFERDDVTEPAKGILFGNGYRLKKPSDRLVQFTDKCRTNAKRLNSSLVQTSDLYEAVRYIVDHPEDEEFKAKCREAIERDGGHVVTFPGIGGDIPSP